MQIRVWEKRDVEKIAAIEKACFSDPWSKEMLSDCLRYPYYRCFVAEEGGELCGYCCLILLFDDGEVANVAVKEERRGQGIAKALMEKMHAVALEEGARRTLLEVRKSNAPAIALYRAFGYEIYGERAKYYPDGENAILMKKNLS